MTTWHEASKSNDKNLLTDLKSETHEMIDAGDTIPSVPIEAVGDKLIKAVKSEGGDIYTHSQILTDTWERIGRSYSFQAIHVSAVEIATRAVDILIESKAPPAALVVLALAFKSGADRLLKRARELDPDLADEVDRDL